MRLIARVPVPDAPHPRLWDCTARLARLAAVVDLAKRQYEAGSVTDLAATLKIFTIPEFYFRPSWTRDSRTYEEEDRTYIIECLQTMFQHEDFRDWLFVCGSCAWNSIHWDPTRLLTINSSLCIKGGTAFSPTSLTHKRTAFDRDALYDPAHSSEHARPIFDSLVVRRKSILNVDHRCFGTEIGVDHRSRALAGTLDLIRQADGAAPPVDIQMVIACGAAIDPAAKAARPGGYILRNDGYPSGGAPSQIFRVSPTPDHHGNYVLGPEILPSYTIYLPNNYRVQAVPYDPPEEKIDPPPPPQPPSDEDIDDATDEGDQDPINPRIKMRLAFFPAQPFG